MQGVSGSGVMRQMHLNKNASQANVQREEGSKKLSAAMRLAGTAHREL